MYKIIKIGEINNGIDGTDVYYRVESDDKTDIDIQDVQEFMYKKYAFDSRRPGDSFCNSIYAVHEKHYKAHVIVTAHIRYDI